MSRSIFNTYKDFTGGTPDELVNVKWFGAVGDGSVAPDGSTPDQAAIEAAIAYCVAKNLTLGIPDGTYKHKTAINWAFNNLHVVALGDDVVFVHTGSGIAHNFSGMITYPGPLSQGCFGGVFGGPNKIMLKGNPAGGPSGTSIVVNIDNWHFGRMNVAIRDGATGLYGRDTGHVGSSAVATTFDIDMSTNIHGAYLVQPGHGIDFTAPVACIFEKLIVEGCGARGLKAALFTDMINCTFRGGTIEGNSAGGLVVANSGTGSSRNTYHNLQTETNGTAPDWTTAEKNPVLINCSNGGTTAAIIFNSAGATLIGGTFDNLTNNDDTLWSNGTEVDGSYVDNGAHTTWLNPIGGLVTAKENAASILGNKTINTQNAITFKINGNTVSDITGSGSIVALSISPRFTGQVEIGANVAPDATLTVNNNTGATVAAGIANDLHLVAADNSFGGILSDVYSGEAIFAGRCAGGTRAAKTAAGAGAYLALAGQVWDGSAYASNAAVEFLNVNPQTPSDHSSRIRIQTVPTGGTTPREVVSFGSGMSVGTATDYGLKNLLVAGSVATAPPITLTGTSGSVGASDSSIIVNASGPFTLTLPPAASYSGRWLSLKSIAAQTVNSASSNVVPLAGGAAGTALLTAAGGKWASLQSDGANWIVMSAN
jgi:hypothetical protein